MEPQPQPPGIPLNGTNHVAVIPTTPTDRLQLIPEEILRKILIFCDIPSLMSLGDTSTSYQALVYRASPWLWKEFDFGKVAPGKTRKVTDASLASLLTAVNARNVTTSLSLMGCTSVRGAGLDPLRGSRCLEVVDLRRTQEEIKTCGETGLNDVLVIEILSTMAPISGVNHGPSGLKVVKFRKQQESRNFYERFSDNISRFYDSLTDARTDQVVQHRVRCRSCNDVIVDRIPQEDLNLFGAMYCEGCNGFLCDEPNCSFVATSV